MSGARIRREHQALPARPARLGLGAIRARGAAKEGLGLEYAENPKLSLPVENIELLSRFGHEEGLLDKLGAGAWQARKARLKERIKPAAGRAARAGAGG